MRLRQASSFKRTLRLRHAGAMIFDCQPRHYPGVAWRVWFDLISMSISPVEKVHSRSPTTKTRHHETDQ
jgi:hypothetical protein